MTWPRPGPGPGPRPSCSRTSPSRPELPPGPGWQDRPMPTAVPAGATPLVGIVMGSSSDLPTMRKALDVLAGLGVACEIGVRSAHRDPFGMLEYGRTAADRGLKVVIAGAGGAAHLPGMLAAATILPVIGVPVSLRNLD